jgi:hypothetical protein
MTKIRVTPIAAAAPPIIGPQLMPDFEDSTGIAEVPLECANAILGSPQRRKRTRRMMIGSGIPSSQRRIPRPMMSLLE